MDADERALLEQGDDSLDDVSAVFVNDLIDKHMHFMEVLVGHALHPYKAKFGRRFCWHRGRNCARPAAVSRAATRSSGGPRVLPAMSIMSHGLSRPYTRKEHDDAPRQPEGRLPWQRPESCRHGSDGPPVRPPSAPTRAYAHAARQSAPTPSPRRGPFRRTVRTRRRGPHVWRFWARRQGLGTACRVRGPYVATPRPRSTRDDHGPDHRSSRPVQGHRPARG